MFELYTIGGYKYGNGREKKGVLMRLKRIEGDTRGLQRMVEEEPLRGYPDASRCGDRRDEKGRDGDGGDIYGECAGKDGERKKRGKAGECLEGLQAGHVEVTFDWA